MSGAEPRFAWRGFMLDVARHFHPVETVLAVIDHIAALGLNRLHLHLTDDQGWRIEIDSWPRLTGIGASTQVGGGPFDPSTSSGRRSANGQTDGPAFYTKDDYRRIVGYAAERGIVVVPEIDMPGHTNAALVAYPQLAPTGVIPEPYEGIDVGFSTLDTGNEETYRFVADVIGEVAELTPGPWLHFGGDESLVTTRDDYAAFVSRVAQIVVDAGKVPIGWHEIGRVPDLPPETIIQYWGFLEPEQDHGEIVAAWVRHGGKVILSPADVAYLDIKPHAAHPLGLVWAKGPTSLEAAAGWDPLDLVARVDGMTLDDVLGVEAPMFTETIATLADIREMAFPRLDALASIMSEPR